MTPTRERASAAASCALGGLLVLFASGRQWARAVVVEAGFPHVVVHVAGRSVAPAAAGLAFVGLAGAAALFVTRGIGRVATGVLLVLAGLGVIAQSVAVAGNLKSAVHSSVATAVGRTDAVASTLDGSAWPWLAVVGGVLMVVGGVVAVVHGARWPGMSRRYETDDQAHPPGIEPAATQAAAARPDDPADAMWKALDRGEDPTDPDPS